MGKTPSTAGKGDKRRPGNETIYRSNYDAITRCDICGRFVSYLDIESGRAVRNLITPDTDFTSEDWETYHVKCQRAK